MMMYENNCAQESNCQIIFTSYVSIKKLLCIICLIIHFGHEQCQENNRYINHLVKRLIHIHDVYHINTYIDRMSGILEVSVSMKIHIHCIILYDLFCLNISALRCYISLKVSINQDVMMQDAQ